MPYFKKTLNASFVPRLSIESSKIGEAIGFLHVFLHVNESAKKIEIGAAMNREFRLLQCLFSPQNYIAAKYNPVAQTYERAFSAIRMKSDSLSEMSEIVEKSVQNLLKGEVAHYLNFFSEEGRLRLEITALA